MIKDFILTWWIGFTIMFGSGSLGLYLSNGGDVFMDVNFILSLVISFLNAMYFRKPRLDDNFNEL